MKLEENTIAKDFKTNDVFGLPISLESFKGKKVLLSFMRYTGCPVCNLHIYKLNKKKDALAKKNLAIIFIFESNAKSIIKYIKNENLPFTFVSDPKQILYDVYAVEKSWPKFIKWALTFKGLSNAIKGYTKYQKFYSMKGSTNRVGAEFLIDENGILERVHYGKIVGDHMPISYYL